MTRSRNLRLLIAALVIAVAGVLGTPPADATSRAAEPLLPIVFVHGQLGSAQQFETQAMRFTSNGYPQDLLFAFEYNTNLPDNPIADLDTFIDGVLAKTGASKVYAIGHSRGTGVWTTYLGEPARAAKVAKYVNIDGASPAALPGGVPTIGIWGEWNTAGSGFNMRGDTDAQIGPDPAANFHFGSKSHTETATSPEAFAAMYEFLTGEKPKTTDVIPQTGRVSVAGRAVLFPENQGAAGTKVQVWRLDPTGHRLFSKPGATFTIGASGDFGPVVLSPRQHYEFTIVRSTGEEHSSYFEPFLHDDHFLRLNTSVRGSALDAITPDSATTTNLVIVRMRELWGDQGAHSDHLFINGTNVVRANTATRTGVNLAMFVQDDGLDGKTDLGKGELPLFAGLPFLTAIDMSLPAAPNDSGAGTISVREVPRGGGAPAQLNVPNWRSHDHVLTIQFRDYEQPTS